MLAFHSAQARDGVLGDQPVDHSVVRAAQQHQVFATFALSRREIRAAAGRARGVGGADDVRALAEVEAVTREVIL